MTLHGIPRANYSKDNFRSLQPRTDMILKKETFCLFICILGSNVISLQFNTSEIKQYSFQCSKSECRGIYEYCYDNRCRTCNTDACRPPVPGQCQIFCKYVFPENQGKKQKTDGCTRCIQGEHEAVTDKWIIVAGISLPVNIVIVIVTAVMYILKRKRRQTRHDEEDETNNMGTASNIDVTQKMITIPENDHINSNNRNTRSTMSPG